MKKPHLLSGLADALPARWRDEIRAELADDETLLSWVEIDLDQRLKFQPGLVAATDRRLLARNSADNGWESWVYGPQLTLSLTDHAGAAVLELHDDAARLAVWRFTLARNPAALRLLAQFESQQAIRLSGQPEEAPQERNCTVCNNVIPAGEEECPTCNQELAAPSSTWALLRLWRFARPYRGPLLAGFLLTLLGTAATLVPPYLTMPLMDDVLIPFQNGAPIDYDKVRLYLSGLLASALLAWGLGWARTYILAWVSERIGADLRTTTYEHLQQLSLEYFGGKRTGDLISRIGSETDRICVFLSLHLLDFATDILMIVMTAVILVTINPWLALVTLVPLPFIIWMIHAVRDRLRHGFETRFPVFAWSRRLRRKSARSRGFAKPITATWKSTTA
jgi:ATP-binding cassette subfamily B protein